MLGEAEIAEVLPIGAVAMRKAGAVYANRAERFAGEKLAGEKRLCEANHVFASGE